jgi:hypothetical protein
MKPQIYKEKFAFFYRNAAHVSSIVFSAISALLVQEEKIQGKGNVICGDD